MNENKLIGMRVMHLSSHLIGVIKEIQNGHIKVDFHGEIHNYMYPSAFANILEVEDEEIQQEIQNEGTSSSFDKFKQVYNVALNKEINYLKVTGGKRYRIIDGEKISSKSGEYIYSFETDTDLHFPDGTVIKLWFPENIISAYVLSCEDFSIFIRTAEDIGNNIDSVEFTSEQWHLLEALTERLDEMNPETASLAYKVACTGKNQITEWKSICKGQNCALSKAMSDEITFIWGPPGTGKTETLAKIAIEHIKKGRRVLMLSYSNVSVDGALLRVAKKIDLPSGDMIRYGFPRTDELLKSKTLTSYQCVLQSNSVLNAEYQELSNKKKKTKKGDSQRIEINNRLHNIKKLLLDQEKELVQNAVFVATTVSKATVDSAIYGQKFDVVIFDEASMAYVPQVVFSAGLSKQYFVCLGDFCQLPAIVQNNSENNLLDKDIFEHTGILSAVNNEQGHDWLVMLDLQYRMHQEIADFVSKQMYHGILKTSDKIHESRQEISAIGPDENSAMTIMDLSGMYSVCTKTMDGSRINILSALICLRLIEQIIDKFDVGIITPYSAQSRLILSMIRTIREKDRRWNNVSCATVHQFQGSEKPIIIYDAVDCFRMTYPGTLLTSLKNDTANRLFNVALTRAKGKFVLVANIDFLKRKNISKKLMFTQAINNMINLGKRIDGTYLLDELMPYEKEEPFVYIEDREISWEKFVSDIEKAEKTIHIEIPDVMFDNDECIDELTSLLMKKKDDGIDISVRAQEDIDIPIELQSFEKKHKYVTTPVTIIDKKILWFGQPLYAADFISENNILDTEYFPCARFVGTYAARLLQAFLEI